MDLAARNWWPQASRRRRRSCATSSRPSSRPGAGRDARAVLADSLRLSGRAGDCVDGRQPQHLVGTGLVEEGRIAISLGTSDTVFGPMSRAARRRVRHRSCVWRSDRGVHGADLLPERIAGARARARGPRLTWSEFSHALASTPAGNGGRVMLPWFSPEITPPVSAPGVHRYGPTA